MVRVKDGSVIHGAIDEVFRCFWDATLWPKLTPHVKRVEMIEQSRDRQRFAMTVESDGKQHTVETNRLAVPNHRISYEQSRPPAFLRRHRGEWTFFVEPQAVRVSLVHEAEVDETKLHLLGAKTLEEAEAIVRHNLSANGTRTMLAIKTYIEG